MKKYLATITILLSFAPFLCHAANWSCPGTYCVAWYKFDEGSGSTANDSSGNGFTGTNEGTPTYVVGKVGAYALSVNSSNYSQITGMTGANTWAGTSTMTVSAWIYPTTSGAGQILGQWGGSGNNYVNFCADAGGNPGTPYIYETTTNGFQGIQGSLSIPLNTWSFLTCTYYNSATQKLLMYVNGVQDPNSVTISGFYTFLSSVSPFLVGQDTDGGNDFVGYIDDARIYNTALSQSDVTALYNSYTIFNSYPVFMNHLSAVLKIFKGAIFTI